MFSNFLQFFIVNSRMNYLLFLLIFLVGIYSYVKMPKEIFPSFELDTISIKGVYTGASIDILEKMAVKRIEDEVKNIEGIREMTTVISPEKFIILLELDKNIDKYNTSDKIKDSISLISQYLPNDMDKPTVEVVSVGKALMGISVLSSTVPHREIINSAKRLKEKISTIKNIESITIYGDAEIYYDIRINSQKIQAFGLDEKSVATAIQGLSYIYPIGKLEDTQRGHYYLSTYNGKKEAIGLLDTQLLVEGKHFYLKDIAYVEKRYEDSSTLFSVDKKDAVNIVISMSENGNAFELSTQIHNLINTMNQNDSSISYHIYKDHSIRIKDRLNIVVSNIILGILLITLLVMLLINSRMSFVIFLGVPTSFVLGAFYLYITGQTINLVSLIGVLIALGIIVDDAIVVSENIQQHIEAGKEPKEASLLGAKEMFKPVTIASLTTLFAFIPALMIEGRLGQVIELIPITVSVLVLASLVESFVFLPIHAAHVLTPKSKPRSWDKANQFYKLIVSFLIKYRKSFLTIFIILVPLLIFKQINESRFKMFPKFDSTIIKIAFKAKANTSTEESLSILKIIEEDIYKYKEQFSIEHMNSIAGWRQDSTGERENYPYVGQITIELHALKAQNFLDTYITPSLSFYDIESNPIRDKKSTLIAQELRDFIKKENYQQRFNLRDIDVIEKTVGAIRSDIKIGLISNNNTKVIHYMQELKEYLLDMKGVIFVDDGIKFGIDEIKLKVNSYGESLGLNEQKLGEVLSSLYLEKKIAIAFDSTNLLEFRLRSEQKDSLESFKDFKFDLGEYGKVVLKDVVDFQTIKSFEKVVKDSGEKNFYLYANINSKMITSSEVIMKLQPLLENIRAEGIKVKFKGEYEKQETLKSDMLAASILSLVLITLCLLYLFNSFRETFMMISVIPLSLLGVLIGHDLFDVNLSLFSIIGMLGLSGVVINDGIIMMMKLKKATDLEEIYHLASSRFRPIILTTVTTVLGLSTLMLFPTGQAIIFQPMAITLGCGLLWGTMLNLFYLPVLFVILKGKNFR